MKTDIQIVFLDIDGTLYYDGKLVHSAVKAVEMLLQKNILISLCTGRSAIHTRKIQQRLKIPCGVYFNGSLACHLNRRIHATPLHKTTVGSVIEQLSDKEIPLILHMENKVVSFQRVPRVLNPLLQQFDFPPIQIVERTVWIQHEEPVFQINAFMNKSLEHETQESFPECLIYRWDELAVDLQRRQSDKSIGATALLNYFNISPAHALHIGDGGNDIGMFKTMGYSVAMGNASDEVKSFAKTVTRPAYDDGVYTALQDLGLIE